MTVSVVYGPSYSTYVRTVRLVLEEKAAAYRLVELDTLKAEHKTAEHLARHPFGKVPAFEHDGFTLYETSAIARYLDAAFAEPPLTPADARGAARMQQAIAVVDAYAYPALIGTVAIQRLVAPLLGAAPDEAAIMAALPMVELSLQAFETMLDGSTSLAAEGLCLADLHLAPIMAYFVKTPEGQRLLPSYPGLQRRWEAIAARPSMERTRSGLG
jgi:glutathione S-transferase